MCTRESNPHGASSSQCSQRTAAASAAHKPPNINATTDPPDPEKLPEMIPKGELTGNSKTIEDTRIPTVSDTTNSEDNGNVPLDKLTEE